MQRDKEYWGADADEWRPERFEKRKLGKEFLPFNAGPRYVGALLVLYEVHSQTTGPAWDNNLL